MHDVAQGGAVLESIKGVARRGRTDVRLEPVAVDDIDRAFEQSGNIVFQSGIVKDGDLGRRIKFKYDVDITLWTLVNPRAQRGPVLPQPGDDVIAVHGLLIPEARAIAFQI